MLDQRNSREAEQKSRDLEFEGQNIFLKNNSKRINNLFLHHLINSDPSVTLITQ